MALGVKNPPANVGDIKRCRFDHWIRKIPWRRAQQPTPVVFSLVNPRDRGAWQAMVHRVAQSQIQQKQLSVRCACVSLPPLSPSYHSMSSQNARLDSSHYTATSHQLLGFPVAQTVKNLSATQETRVRSLGQENPLEKEMATHSSILAWRIPRTEEPGWLQSMGSQRVGHD